MYLMIRISVIFVGRNNKEKAQCSKFWPHVVWGILSSRGPYARAYCAYWLPRPHFFAKCTNTNVQSIAVKRRDHVQQHFQAPNVWVIDRRNGGFDGQANKKCLAGWSDFLQTDVATRRLICLQSDRRRRRVFASIPPPLMNLGRRRRYNLVNSFIPDTHRRRRRDSTVELSRVGGVYGIRNYSWRHSTSLNKFAKSDVELRLVGDVNAPIGSRRELVANSVHTADTTQLDSCDRGDVLWMLRRQTLVDYCVRILVSKV